MHVAVLHAVLVSASIIWFSWSPESEFHESAVCPPPTALLVSVITSDPVCVLFFTHKGVDSLGGDLGEVPAFIQAEVFRGSPALFVIVEEVTVVAKPLPAMFTG